MIGRDEFSAGKNDVGQIQKSKIKINEKKLRKCWKKLEDGR